MGQGMKGKGAAGYGGKKGKGKPPKAKGSAKGA